MAFEPGLEKCLSARPNCSTQFLPPGNVAELYEEYKATQDMLGSPYISYLDTW